MFSRLLRSTRRFASLFTLTHALLAAFAPILHAHSAEPLNGAGGFHAYFEMADASEAACPGSGQPNPLFTAEVAEQQRGKNLEGIADAPELLIPFTVAVSYPPALTQAPPTVSTLAAHAERAAIAPKATTLSCAKPPRPQAP